jgi:hypothetical protein
VLSVATFLKTDVTAQGTWKGVYGADGEAIANDATSYPSYAQVTLAGQGLATWAASTTDVRGLQKGAASDRIASTWWAGASFSIDVNLSDGNTHQIALYCLDWDGGNVRRERIDVLDAASSAVLDSRTVSSFSAGEYVVWNISGHVTFRMTALAGNTVVSGVFFGGTASSGATATFSKVDSTTQGAWKGVYGADGSAVAVDSTNYPGYTQVTVGGTAFTWAASTSDARALQTYAGTSRIASAWYSGIAYTIGVNVTDGNTHQVALYCLDWDGSNVRSERIDVLDASNGSVLDSRTVSSFSGGQYVVWNIAGYVTFRVTPLAGNAVVSGIFFR